MKKLSVLFVFMLICTGLVFSGTITVNKPDGSIAWFKGNTYLIKWTPNGCQQTDYKINIFKGSAVQANFKLQLTASGVTQKNWKIPADFEAGTYVIRVKAENTCLGDSNDFEIKNKFQINPGVLKDVLEKVNKKPIFKPSKGMFKPVIEGVLDIPLGALKPGTKLYLKGKKFGTNKGKIVVKGNFPGGQFELINVKWESSEKANGVVPLGVNGNPNQTVGVVLVTSYNTKSDPWNMKFEGREEKVLFNDIVGVNCGNDGNCNYCNNHSDCGSQFIAGCPDEYAICGYHDNNWGAVGDDIGNDVFSINLKNGWVFKSMQKVQWKKSSGDEKLSGPSPSFPTGQSNWTAVINWKVTPNDHVAYKIKIIVEGPIGTNYK